MLFNLLYNHFSGLFSKAPTQGPPRYCVSCGRFGQYMVCQSSPFTKFDYPCSNFSTPPSYGPQF